MTLDNKNIISVIGGGPAGMMASIIASENKNNDVYLFEKNNSLGKKLLLTGKGRCNITNSESNIKNFISFFGTNGKFLYNAFNVFFNEDLLDFFRKKGVDFVYERGNRVFPKSEDSHEILETLKKYLKENNVKIETNKSLSSIEKKKDKFILKFQDFDFVSDKVIIACGGKSYPGTGSTGEIFNICKKLGHTIVSPVPSLVPIVLKEKFISRLEGLSLKNVKASVSKNNKQIISQFGDMLFTDNGVSGPIVLSLSKYICREDLKNLVLTIDLKPALNIEQLNSRIRREMNEKNIIYKSLLKLLLPSNLIPIFLEILKVDENKKIKHLSKEEISKLVDLLKNFKFEIKSLENFGHSIVTSGGVSTKEINPKTMESKKIIGLYFAGEIIDIDGETGGFNLQAAFSTGFVAGKSV